MGVAAFAGFVVGNPTGVVAFSWSSGRVWLPVPARAFGPGRALSDYSSLEHRDSADSGGTTCVIECLSDAFALSAPPTLPARPAADR